MLKLIPAPYRLLAGLLALASLFGAGVYTGHDWATTRAAAARADAAEAHAAQILLSVRRGDALAAQLAAAEARVIIKTVEVIKHVPQVTTGRLCLSADAVGLLQPGETWGPDFAAGRPAAESAPHAAASDRDVAYWAADANRLYQTCAGRLNALIDWHQPE